jgi:hypothetical protein
MKRRVYLRLAMTFVFMFTVASCDEQALPVPEPGEMQNEPVAEDVGNLNPAAHQPSGVISLEGSFFEIDANANLTADNAGWIDWASKPAGMIVQLDKPTGQSDDSFGNGTKEDTIVPSIVSGSIPPNKSDLKEFGLYQERNADGNFLHLFWSRVQDPSGTTNMDFEFNQSRDLSSNGVTPVRTVGDMLITYDLSRGGSVATISVRFWQGTVWGPSQTLNSTTAATGSINTSAIETTVTGVTATDGAGNPVSNHTLGTYSARTFGEASIDLNEVFGAGECRSFGYAYLKSRASDSFTSALKDFVPPAAVSVSNCGGLTIVKDAQPNHVQDFAFQTSGPSSGTAAMPTTFQLDDDADVSGGDTTLLNSRTFTDLIAGSYTITETLVTNWSLTSVTCVGGSFGSTPTEIGNGGDIPVQPDDNITCTFTNVLQLGSLSISKVDDAGNAMAGITFDLYTDVSPFGPTNPRTAADTQTSFTCTTDAAGNCSISNVPLGQYWVVEDSTTVPAGYTGAGDQHVNLTSASTPLSLTFTNPRQHRVIVIVCHEGTNTLAASNVTNGSGSATSLATAPAGLTEAQLCGLGGASFGGLDHTTKELSVEVGSASHPVP